MATVTINNYEQQQVDQRMVTSELINNSLLGAGRQLIKGVQKSAARFKAGATGMKAGVGKKALGSKAYGAGKAVRGAGIQAKRGGLKASKFAKSPAGKMTGMGAGLGATAGAGVATGMAMGRRKK